jgi:hypothetical protein
VATGECAANSILKKDFLTNDTVTCACSLTAGFYIFGSACLSCTTQPQPNMASSDCLACNNDAGFYKLDDQCFYCPSLPNTVGDFASVNGCDCKEGYYWNILKGACDCDWLNGYIDVAGVCLNCSALPHTLTNGTKNACKCAPGYKWEVDKCVCDASSGSYFDGGDCVNCLEMYGSLEKALSGDRCACTTGYTWDINLQKCVCDPKQNFILIGEICKDCFAVSNSNGYSSPYGCACKADYFWSPTTFECLVCSSASGHVLID